MSYLARLAAQATGVGPAADALRPMPSFLRPGAAPTPWTGETTLEIVDSERHVGSDAPAPLTPATAGVPAQQHPSATPPAQPTTNLGSPPRRESTEVANAFSVSLAHSRTRAVPPEDSDAIAVSALLEPAPDLAASASPGAIAEAGREASEPERRDLSPIAVSATRLPSVHARLASPAPETHAPAPSVEAAGTITGSEPTAAEPPTVTVTIERIDVIAPRQASARPARAQRPAPTLSLDAYLAGRSDR